MHAEWARISWGVQCREKVKKYWLYGNVSLGFDGHGYVQDKDKYEIW